MAWLYFRCVSMPSRWRMERLLWMWWVSGWGTHCYRPGCGRNRCCNHRSTRDLAQRMRYSRLFILKIYNVSPCIEAWRDQNCTGIGWVLAQMCRTLLCFFIDSCGSGDGATMMIFCKWVIINVGCGSVIIISQLKNRLELTYVWCRFIWSLSLTVAWFNQAQYKIGITDHFICS